MLIAIAIFCSVCEAAFTALEVALSTVSRARLRALIEAEREAEREQEREAEREPSAGASHRASQSTSPLHSQSTAAANAPRASGPRLSTLRRRAERLLRVMEHTERLTLAFITVTALSLWAAVSVLTWQAISDHWPWWALLAALVAVLFVAEVLPLLIAARNGEVVALRGVGLLEVSLRVLSPVLWLLGGLGHALARLLGAGPNARPQVTEGELRTALAAAEEEGVIESDERALLEGAMDFREKVVREVMTPRIDIIGVAAPTPLAEVLDVAMQNGHSRLPVYESTLDRILGIVSAKDLIPYLRAAHLKSGTGENVALPCARDVARPPFFVPENKRIAATLDDLRRERTLMAIVVDADGGTAGLVTLEDLLEEIVGEIQDEYDEEEPSLRVDEAASLVAEGNVTLRDVERFWQKHFDEKICLCDDERQAADASLSMAALSLHLFDGVPQSGDRVRAGWVADRDELSASALGETTTAPLELEVLAMDGPRIESVRLRKIAVEGHET